ncbi:MAG: hypothetical protein A2V98_22805 [Planctomycetes bacterium RBG_16_64_12]|nr:MAG: hypothetical protein A2V98_22805 [Planctomycetes bacterium RBG_16_64_12]
MDLGAVLMGLVTAGIVKLLVMTLTGVLLVRLFKVSDDGIKKPWLLIPREHQSRFRVLRWGLIFFAVSELACGIEIYVLSHSNALLACLHSMTSSVGMGLTAIGLFQIFDWKYLHFVDTTSPCIAMKTCEKCTKRQQNVCQYRPLLLMMAALLMLLTVPVFFAPTERLHADPGFYVLPFDSLNHWYDDLMTTLRESNPSAGSAAMSTFYLPEEMLVLEFRLLPILGMLLAAASIACFLGKQEDLAVAFLLFAVGNHAYVYFEVMIYGLTQEPILGFLLHECGELFFLVMVSNLLPRMFPKGPRSSVLN